MMIDQKKIPAFPLAVGEPTSEVNEGMTLRDYFAAAALTGLWASAGEGSFGVDAESCYEMADAMLAERSKPD